MSTRSVLAGNGYLDPGGQDDVVGGDLLARRRHHPVGFHHDGTVPNHSAVGRAAPRREEDPRKPGWIHQRPQSGDVVHEGVLRLDEHHVVRLVQRLGHGGTAVAATDHYHRGLAT